MPYSSDKKHIGKTNYDRRIKVKIDDKINIRGLYSMGIPIREIVRKYYSHLSRRTIQFILFPERKLIAAEQRKVRGKLLNHYYDKEKHKNYMKTHRRYKHSIEKLGVLKISNK